MADCAVVKCSHCFQERNRFKKDLNKWTKSLLLSVGLERIAQELMGGKKWRKMMAPFYCFEPNEPQDWLPDEACYFCNNSIKHDFNSNVQHSESFQTNNTGSLSPQYLPSITSDLGSNIINSPPEQPLDLSLHSRSKSDLNYEQIVNDKSLLKIPQPSTAKPSKKTRPESDTKWKRTYTEEKLQLALKDIQSGKLGTRRAALIYGIPRSTLRNKVYKLASDRKNGKKIISDNKLSSTGGNTESGSALDINYQPNIFSQGNLKCDTKSSLNEIRSSSFISNDSSASESLKAILKQAVAQRANNFNSKNLSSSSFSSNKSENKSESDPFSLSQLSNLFGDSFSSVPMLSTLDCGTPIAPLISQLLFNVHQLARNRQNDNLINCDLNNSLFGTLPLLPDLIHKIAQERFDQENHSLLESRDMLTDNSSVILKIPSYEPKSSNDLLNLKRKEFKNRIDVRNTNGTISSHHASDCETASKDENINSFYKPQGNNICSNSLLNVNSDDSSSETLLGENRISSNIKREKSEGDKRASNNSNASDQSDPSTPDSKRNRPKRGRYRNYNRDDLAKAVRAVQKGEMSVHRAGTLFGVPHSTLEYKVKQRHLLRPKKRQSNSSLLSSSSSSSQSMLKKETSKNSETIETGLNINKLSTQPHNNLSSSSNLNDLPWQSALPLFSLDLASSQNSTNFFASNMIKKLRETARLNKETCQNKNSNKFGGLLLETLIKFSLEKRNKNQEMDCNDQARDQDIDADQEFNQDQNRDQDQDLDQDNDNDNENDNDIDNDNDADDDADDDDDEDEEEEESKYNSSLSVLKQVSSLDKKD